MLWQNTLLTIYTSVGTVHTISLQYILYIHCTELYTMHFAVFHVMGKHYQLLILQYSVYCILFNVHYLYYIILKCACVRACVCVCVFVQVLFANG